jgi:flavin reductase (DIM6/NTAB) family NADH-FMN oxidoreductase RutF
MTTHLSAADISIMERIARLTLVNSISGFKSGNLIGTAGKDGVTNLAVFSSVVHLGSEPALLGLVTRPLVPGGKTSRHTYQNIVDTGFFTINHIHSEMVVAAHQCSASYDDGVSEFEAVGLTPVFYQLPVAPYVAESRIKIGLELAEIIPIPLNGTMLIIGRVEELLLPSGFLANSGHLNLDLAGTVAVSGLDGYHSTQLIERLPYARI